MHHDVQFIRVHIGADKVVGAIPTDLIFTLNSIC